MITLTLKDHANNHITKIKVTNKVEFPFDDESMLSFAFPNDGKTNYEKLFDSTYNVEIHDDAFEYVREVTAYDVLHSINKDTVLFAIIVRLS